MLEDASRLPSALVYREIRQRCYAVLFCNILTPSYQDSQAQLQNGDSIVIKEWCAYKGNLMKNPELIKPLQLVVQPFQENESML